MTETQFQKRSRRVRLAWLLAAVLLVLALVYSLWPRAVEVDLTALDRGTVRAELVDEGRTRMHEVYVVSAPVAGRVLRVDVEPGDAVTAGAVIARLTRAAAGFLDSRTDLQARAGVDAANAQQRAADTGLALAEREHERTRNLADQKLVSAAAVDNSQAQLDAARARRDAARADVARARSALQPAERTVAGTVPVRAPVAGRVLRVLQESESVVPVGAPLIEIGDPSRVEVVAEFLSQDAVRMRKGQAAQIENWGGAALAATVDRVEPVARTKISALGVEEQRTNVILQFNDSAAAASLGHDFRVDARVVIEESKAAVRVPLGALFRVGEGWGVYRVENNRAQRVALKTGIADGSYREVLEGLAATDSVVLFPSSAVQDGVRVRQRPGGAASPK